MEALNILKTGLVIHITGIVVMVGTILASFIIYQHFWKTLPAETDKAATLFNLISRFQIVQMIGGALIVTGGITMMMVLSGGLMYALWFKIKMFLLLLIILNALFLTRPAGLKLKRILVADPVRNQADQHVLAAIRQKITISYLLQLLFFLTIFILSSFQFH